MVGEVRVPFTAGYGRIGTECMTDLPVSRGRKRFIDRLYRNGGGAKATSDAKAGVSGFKDERTLDEKNAGSLNGKKNGKNGANKGLNGKKIELQEKMEEAVKEYLGKKNGKKIELPVKTEEMAKDLLEKSGGNGNGNGLNGKEMLVEKAEMPEQAFDKDAIALRHWPLFESVCTMIHGRGVRKTTVPITVEMVGHIAEYFYMSWFAKHYSGESQPPDMETVNMKLENLYGPKYISGLIELKDQFAKQGERQATFVFETRRKVYGAAAKIIEERMRVDKEAAILKEEKEGRLSELKREETEAPLKIDEQFKNKIAEIDEYFSGKVHQGGQLIELIKKYGLKYGVPIGAGAFTVASKAWQGLKDWVVDITEHIPLLAGIPPELVSIGIGVLWGGYHVGKALWERHLKNIKATYLLKAEKAKEKAIGRLVEEEASIQEEYAEKVAHLMEDFEGYVKGTIEELHKVYKGMLYQYSMLSGN